jgi:glycylpeptide N-tetradecanoyltransferase
MNLKDPDELKEVYELLTANYVEDDAATFRFRYTAEFLEWYTFSAHNMILILNKF